MSAASKKIMDECNRFCSSMAPYVDGELDPGHAVDMEAHVTGCAPCAERIALLRATRHSLKRSCASRAPAALRARLCATMATERARSAEVKQAQETMAPKLIRLRYAVGLAAAAGVVFAMGMHRVAQHAGTNVLGDEAAIDGDPTTDVRSARASMDILNDLVSLHENPLPPETTNPEVLPNWDPFVGVPVRRPALQPFDARFNGARVLPLLANRRAALLQYTVHGGHRVTVYVFNPRTLPVETMSLDRRLMGARSVYVGSLRGYSVAAGKHSGVGYALASDLGTDESAQMVLAALNQ